jgi:hypothetical protein
MPKNIMQPDGSSPYSQSPAIGPYPEPVKLNPHFPSYVFPLAMFSLQVFRPKFVSTYSHPHAFYMSRQSVVPNLIIIIIFSEGLQNGRSGFYSRHCENLYSACHPHQIGARGLFPKREERHGRVADQSPLSIPTRSRFSVVFLCPRANAESVPKFHVALHASHAALQMLIFQHFALIQPFQCQTTFRPIAATPTSLKTKIEQIPHTILTSTRRTSGHCLGTFKTANFVWITILPPPNTVVSLLPPPPKLFLLSVSIARSLKLQLYSYSFALMV